jgi:hypothetical protein
VCSHESHGILSWDAVKDRDAGQSSPGTSAAAAAGDLHTVILCPPPRVVECLYRTFAIAWQAEVRTVDPPHGPRGRWRLLAQQT